ncbi:efflux RND transporter periplasmic adaptor subunit [Deinococcus aestuarii]|uniref:efflux RND transporter periplasmic adaptor subunit n=1 Tax=Deinococcus aestuarii TaxID=2774531 RepID=UPI001C0C0DE0|nr:efflux RND transporter periplasmic adaptor subunit [Deinococcus aestuarii]
MNMRLVVLTAAAFSALGGAVAMMYRTQHAPQLSVNAEAVLKQPFDQITKANGVIEGRSYRLSFARAGTVEELNVAEGEEVHRGQVLAQLDVSGPTRQLALIERAEQELRRNAGLQALDGEVKLRDAARALQAAERAANAERQLYALGAVSLNDLQAAQRAAQDARDALQSARIGRDLAASSAARDLTTQQGEAQQLRDELRQSRLVSPVDGFVTDVGFRVGETSADQTLFVVQRGTLRIKLDVQESELVRIRPHERVDVFLNAYDDQRVQGTVGEITSQATTNAGGSSTLSVYVNFGRGGAARKLIPGLSVRADIHTLELPHAIVVPTGAVVRGGTGSYVWTVQQERLARQPIRVIGANPTRVAITGVRAGTEVVLSPDDGFEAGTRVRVAHD